jgi:hypothetical protein
MSALHWESSMRDDHEHQEPNAPPEEMGRIGEQILIEDVNGKVHEVLIEDAVRAIGDALPDDTVSYQTTRSDGRYVKVTLLGMEPE